MNQNDNILDLAKNNVSDSNQPNQFKRKLGSNGVSNLNNIPNHSNELNKNLNKKNNTNNIKNISSTSKHSLNPYVRGLTRGINAKDKLGNGNASKRLSSALNKANTMSNLKKMVAQKALNKVSDNNLGDKVANVANVLSGRQSLLSSLIGSKQSEKSENENSMSFIMPRNIKVGLIAFTALISSLVFIIMIVYVNKIYTKNLTLGQADLLSSESGYDEFDNYISDSDVDEELFNYEDNSSNLLLKNDNDVSNLVFTSSVKYFKRKYNEASFEELESFYSDISVLGEKYDKELVYQFFAKMYNVYTKYRDKYNVTIDLPLLMATLQLQSEDLSVVFESNVSYNKLTGKFSIYYDYDKDYSNYKLSKDESYHDMELLAKHMVKKEEYNGSNCEKSINGYCYIYDEDGYKEFLLEFIEKKYYLSETSVEEEVKNTQPSVTDGDWRNWKQCDDEWASLTMPGGATMCSSGCYVTSISILIAKSGTKVNYSNFNPGVAVKHFSFKGNLLLEPSVTKNVAPNFKQTGKIVTTGLTKEQVASKILENMDENTYAIIQVSKKNQSSVSHFVALDYVDTETNEIYMIDPANTGKTKVYDIYKIYAVNFWKKTD